MGLGFLPSRDKMMKEIEQWTVLKKLDTLTGLCNCCLYRVFDLVQECRTCKVQRGIESIAGERSEETVACGDLLGSC